MTHYFILNLLKYPEAFEIEIDSSLRSLLSKFIIDYYKVIPNRLMILENNVFCTRKTGSKSHGNRIESPEMNLNLHGQLI